MLDPALAQLLSDAALQADRLARRHDLQPADRDDAFQDIALDGWRRSKSYQKSRGELEPFLGVVTLNQARKIDARLRRRWADPVSLNIPIVDDSDDGDLTLEDSLTQDDGLPALLGNVVDGHARSELILDLARAMARLGRCRSCASPAPGASRTSTSASSTRDGGSRKRSRRWAATAARPAPGRGMCLVASGRSANGQCAKAGAAGASTCSRRRASHWLRWISSPGTSATGQTLLLESIDKLEHKM